MPGTPICPEAVTSHLPVQTDLFHNPAGFTISHGATEPGQGASCKDSRFRRDYLLVNQDISAEPLETRFGALVLTYGAAIRRLSRVYLSEPADQQDLFQEICLALWTALPRYRGDASERTWVYRVAHNVALTLRGRHQRRLREAPFRDPRSEPADTHDLRLDLYQLIRRLSAVDRQLITLHLEGLTAREIAEITGLPPRISARG